MLTWTTVFLVSNVFPTLRIAAESSWPWGVARSRAAKLQHLRRLVLLSRLPIINKLSALDSEHDITLVGAFGDWHALNCRKCCGFWKGLYDLSKHHESASDCVSERRQTNLERFHRLAPSLPSQAVDLCTKIWKLTKSDRKIISVPFCHFDLAKINKGPVITLLSCKAVSVGKPRSRLRMDTAVCGLALGVPANGTLRRQLRLVQIKSCVGKGRRVSLI